MYNTCEYVIILMQKTVIGNDEEMEWKEYGTYIRTPRLELMDPLSWVSINYFSRPR